MGPLCVGAGSGDGKSLAVVKTDSFAMIRFHFVLLEIYVSDEEWRYGRVYHSQKAIFKTDS